MNLSTEIYYLITGTGKWNGIDEATMVICMDGFTVIPAHHAKHGSIFETVESAKETAEDMNMMSKIMKKDMHFSVLKMTTIYEEVE